jgi:cell division protein FtsI/penicillin-binding protein 2
LSSSSRAVERRRKLVGRALPIGVAAALAFLAGALLGSSSSEEATAAKRFAQAWSAQDFEGMHRELTPAAREEYPLERFRRAYTEAQAAVTAVRVSTGEVEVVDSSQAAVDVALDTHAFGRLEGRLDLPLDEAGRIDWEPHLVFFGLGPGERLDRVTDIGARGKILARDGTPLAEGPATARSSPLGAAALAIAGSVGSPSRKQEKQLHARGFPPDAPTGTSGLELAFNDRLAGRPGGQLLAVPKGGSVSDGRVLARSEPVDGRNVKTTIDPKIQQAAVEALGGLYGGVAALDVDTGQVLAVAGLAFSAPQPPGSTFKVITATAALDAGVVKTDDTFPVEVSNSKIGREIANSSDAPCGGTFVESFANSCNTVFAPLGVEVGGEKLVETAEAFGFNEPPSLMADEAQAALDPPASTIPNPIEGDVAVGESAIGQGQVLATPLQMASVAQTIANGGTRLPTQIVRTRELRPDAEPVEVTSPETAATVKDLMVEVVRNGTGRAAALPDVQVAGKTGTAELGPKALEPGQELAEGQEPEQELDAWFTAFAPAGKPKVAVAVMIVNATGDGGVVAAPIAREVLAAAL